MTTATEILAQLEELWAKAEPGPTKEGDAIIYRYGEGDFKVELCAERSRFSQGHIRTLERAPKPEPKPRVVMASWVHAPDHREPYTLQDAGEWESLTYAVEADDLVDPVEMVELPSHRELMDAMSDAFGVSFGLATDIAAGAVLELLRGER